MSHHPGPGGFPEGQAFRWTSSGGMVGLGFLSGASSSFARAASADGSVVVGRSPVFSSPLPQQAFRWTSVDGMVGLGFLPGDDVSVASGVSADGSVVVGSSAISGGASDQAFRWTAVGGMVGLGTLPGGFTSGASGVSADGSVVVGLSFSFLTGSQAFRWTLDGGIVGLGFLPGDTGSEASAVSADGLVVVGVSRLSGPPPGPDQPFIWDAAHGMRPLQQVLTAAGLDLRGWTLISADAISADGLTIVGDGINPGGQTEAWLAIIPEPGTGLLVMVGLLGLAASRRRRLS